MLLMFEKFQERAGFFVGDFLFVDETGLFLGFEQRSQAEFLES